MIKFIIFLLFSCSNIDTPIKPKESKESKKLYQTQCSGCHGMYGTGDGILNISSKVKPFAFYENNARWVNGKSIIGISKTITTEPHLTYYSVSRLIDVYSIEKNRKPMDEEVFMLAEYTLFIAIVTETIITSKR